MTDPHPSASVEIDAPIEVVWRVMVDTESYAAWNPFVVRAETAQPEARRRAEGAGRHVRRRK